MNRDERPQKERPSTGTTSCADPELADLLEALWDDGQSPQKIELMPGAIGKIGKRIDFMDFKANPPRPSKEKTVEWSNKFVGTAQRATDTAQKPSKYIVIVTDERRGSDPVKTYSFRLNPKQRIVDGDDEGDGDEFGKDLVLRRTNSVMEDARLDRGQSAAAIGDVLEMYKEENARLRASNDSLMTRCIDMARQLEESLSNREERDLNREKNKFYLEKMGQGANMVMGLLPTIVNGATGKQLMPPGPDPEALTIAAFLTGCTQEQKDRAFGIYAVENGNLVQKKAGALYFEQTVIIDGVSQSKIPAVRLFDLIDGGAHPVTGEQFAEMKTIFSEEQLIPLNVLFRSLQERKAASAAPTQKTAADPEFKHGIDGWK